MVKLNPPHGWRAVIWELAIVTAGVLIALAVQQWADDRSWTSKVEQSKAAIREEVAGHYMWAVEWRRLEPCMLAQVAALEERIGASGSTLTAAPIYHENDRTFVLRMPSKDYVSSAFNSAIADGVASHFDPEFRASVSQHYAIAVNMVKLTAENDAANQEALILAQPIPLDPSVRFQILEKLNRLRGRIDFMSLGSGQMIDHIVRIGMQPPRADIKRETERWATFRFCTAHHLPMRSLAEAMKPIPN